jgi:chemotaxis signal transduction protein
LHGRAAAAIDLRRLLGYESRVPPMLGLAVERDGNHYVLLVDEVGEVLSRLQREFLPAPEPEQGRSGRLCVGVCTAGDSSIAVLDPDLLLDARFLNSFRTPA